MASLSSAGMSLVTEVAGAVGCAGGGRRYRLKQWRRLGLLLLRPKRLEQFLDSSEKLLDFEPPGDPHVTKIILGQFSKICTANAVVQKQLRVTELGRTNPL
jgi:hypothetical protein